MKKRDVTTEEFLQAFQGTNPFGKNRVSGAGDLEGDVESIHGKEFEALTRRIEKLKTSDASCGLMVMGTQGVGKSHLLARLSGWSETKGTATVLFLHNIVASPERIPRYLLRASVSVLAGLRTDAYGTSGLKRLLHRAVWSHLRQRRPSTEVACRAIEAITCQIDGRGDVGRALERLVAEQDEVDHGILVTDEERRPLPLGPKGKKYLKMLKRGRAAFQHNALRFEGHAALDSLYGLIASARIGDLEVEHPRGRSRLVSEVEAVESLHRLGKFAEQPLLRELLTEEAIGVEDGPVAIIIDERRAKETIAAHLAWRLCLTSSQLTREFIEIEHLETVEFETIHGQIKQVAQDMHVQGFLHATAVDKDLHLQLMQRSQPA